MQIKEPWISAPSVQAIFSLLKDAGFQVIFVGGCVRNALLKQDTTDIDLSTNALPEQVLALCRGAGMKAIPSGIDHGTLTIVHGGIAYEITTWRRDVETDGRRAVVAYSDKLEDDARRRDFTINALYADRTGQLIDPLGGLPDLFARRIRFIENADQRIAEDALRILRFFRFLAGYGDKDQGADPEGLAACVRAKSKISTLSKERIGAEMRKLLDTTDPTHAITLMFDHAILEEALPGADATDFRRLVALDQITPGKSLRRLALLGARDAVAALRLSRKEARYLDQLAGAEALDQHAGELGYRLGFEMARDVLLIRAARQDQPLSPAEIAQAQEGAEATFPLKAADLPGHLQGPEIGATLKRLEARWIRSGFTATKDILLASLIPKT